ncbi:ABC transporter substrate-binding protein [Novosphingobium mangrovi (ex Hu et al. 2023)]|uniref:ABC transporter substrate-binding protein n=1 Tax=Novosphingobium mangrovi (ex Hu et al. 2023) TaxID=2930094 RepID=A0ABT0AE01_9SPHN|nr:ABC transporter substrate-binding protein [Novosphingobium mangrovi (ex Hu et al. 2023)]MCJ1961417.1 ABC transporter substrate-binding protein [Novosphingobium mangrovi (ex Hu et al. 2023)]
MLALVLLLLTGVAGIAAFLFGRPAPVCIALANSLTGPSSSAGQESLSAARIALAQANAAGGVAGRRIELKLFDDTSTAKGARGVVREIAASDCVGVLGHYLSTASLAAGPGYRAARIPALTGTSFVDELTRDNAWYFRAQTTASGQGRSIAEYLAVFQARAPVELVTSSDSFGQSFQQGFTGAYEAANYRLWTFDTIPGLRASSSHALAQRIARRGDAGMIVIGTGADHMADMLMALRRNGITNMVIAAGGAGGPEFLERFKDEPEERREPGYFSRNLSAASPLIFDSAGEQAQALSRRYREETGRVPSWVAAGSYDATRMMIEAIRRAGIASRTDTLQADRARVRQALAKMISPATGVEGLTRPLYFDPQRNIPGPTRMGTFVFGRFATSPQQMIPIERPDLLDIGDLIERGDVVRIGARHYWRQRVVYTGIDLNTIDRVDIRNGTFTADLNLWMRFVGDDTPTQIEFPALADPDLFDASDPRETSAYKLPPGFARPLGVGPEDTLTYRLFRISGDFRFDFNLHDYPFDRQELLIRFQNNRQRSDLVTYVIDTAGLRLAKVDTIAPARLDPYGGLEQWSQKGMRYFVDSRSTTSTLGNPLRFQDNAAITYAGFNAAILLERDYAIYILKTLTPLLLLVLVVFATLILPTNLFRERINIPITAILTSAVLLLSLNSQLPAVGYTVAIEYIFYAFFAVCLGAMLVGISHDALMIKDRPEDAARLAKAGSILYIATVVAIIAFIAWRYGHG